MQKRSVNQHVILIRNLTLSFVYIWHVVLLIPNFPLTVPVFQSIVIVFWIILMTQFTLFNFVVEWHKQSKGFVKHWLLHLINSSGFEITGHESIKLF